MKYVREATGGVAIITIDHSDIQGGAGAVTNEDAYTNNINADPVFTNAGIFDFTLQNTSPAINAGTDVGLTTDYEGNPKSGPNFDIGAYEFQDSTAPITTANVDTGLYNSAQTVTLTCSDGSGVGCDKTYYTTDGTDPDTDSNQYSAPLSISLTTTLKFFSQDKNENSENPIKSKIYTIDTAFPQTSIDSNPDVLINSNSATFTFSATETSTFQCKIDSSAYASCTSPKNYTGLAEGAHTFYVKATDTATNEDATPANYAFTVDTEVPTISDLSPNNTTLSATTTSTNLTLTTSETTTCKYSATSGTDYASMTAFNSTNNTTHSTAISGLNPGTTYDYYMICKDVINESTEAHLTFQIAPEENKTSLNSIKIKIERGTNKFKDTLNITKNKFKLKSQDDSLSNGTVEIYKGGKLWKTITADASGAWSKTLKLKNDTTEKIKVYFYNSLGTLIGNKSVKIKVDTKKPKLTLSPIFIKHRGSIISWQASDNKELDYYEVKLKGIKTKTNNKSFIIPANAQKGTQPLTVTAYDKAGNKTSKSAMLTVSW